MPARNLKLERLSVLLTGALAACDALYLPSVNGPLKRLDAAEYARAHDAITRTAGKVAPAIAAPLLVTDLVLISNSSRARGRVAVSFLLTALNATITFAVNVPINKRFEAEPPEDWEDLRDRWATAHNVRSAVQALAFAVALSGYLRRTPEDEEGR